MQITIPLDKETRVNETSSFAILYLFFDHYFWNMMLYDVNMIRIFRPKSSLHVS